MRGGGREEEGRRGEERRGKEGRGEGPGLLWSPERLPHHGVNEPEHVVIAEHNPVSVVHWALCGHGHPIYVDLRVCKGTW